MHTRAILSATLLAAAVAPLAAADWIRVEPSVGMATLAGHVSYDDNGLAGDRADVSDLGLDGRKSLPAIEIDVSPPLLPIGFNAGAYRFGTSGDSTLAQNLNFGGTTYGASTTISSSLTLRDVYGEVNFQPLHWGLGGASLGLALHQLDATVSVSGLGTTTDAHKVMYYPAVSARAYVSPIDAVQVEAAVQLFKLHYGSTSTQYVDAKAQVGWFPLPISNLGFFAGYRYIAYNLTVEPSSNSSLDAQFLISGPYLGAEARF